MSKVRAKTDAGSATGGSAPPGAARATAPSLLVPPPPRSSSRSAIPPPAIRAAGEQESGARHASPAVALAKVGVAAAAVGFAFFLLMNGTATEEPKKVRFGNGAAAARPEVPRPITATMPPNTLVPELLPSPPPLDHQRANGLSDDDWRFLEEFSKLLVNPLARPTDPQITRVETIFKEAGDDAQIKAALMEGYFRKSNDAISGRRFNEATSALERLKVLNPREPRIYEFETILRAGADDWSGTEASSRKYESLAGESNLGVSYALALSLARLDRTADALSVLGRPAFEVCSTGPATAAVMTACQQASALRSELNATKAAEAGKELFQSERFNIRFDGETQQGVARDVLFVLDRAYVRLADIYDHRPATKIPVVLHAGEDYYTKTGAPRWSGGQYSSHDGRIQIPIRGLPSTLPREMENTLVHELSHAFAADMSSGLTPKDLNEGLAQYMEGLRFESLLGPRELKVLATERRTDVMSFYMLSLVMAQQLVLSRGQGSVNTLLRAMRETGSVDGAFQKVFGRSWESMKKDILETFWRRYS